MALLGLARLTAADDPQASTQPAPTPSTATTAPTSPTSLPANAAPLGGLSGPLTAVSGPPGGLALGRRGLYVAEASPPRLVRIVDGRRVAEAPTMRSPAGVAVDDAAHLVWTWAALVNGDATTLVRGYDAGSLEQVAAARLPGYPTDAVAWKGRLWVAAQALWAVRVDGPASELADTYGVPFDLAADPRRQRVLVATDTALLAVDPRSLRVIDHRAVPLGKPSVAVVGDDAWLGDYRGGPLLRHVDLARSRLADAGPATRYLSTGAIVWSGQHVLWLRDGASETLWCVDPGTGALLGQWYGVQGPVVSRTGVAYVIAAGGVLPLDLTRRCLG